VKLLRRLLKMQAILWAAWGLLALVAPRWLVETLMAQPSVGDAIWLQSIGMLSLVLALLMVLVSQKVDEVWWWSWAFAAVDIGLGTVCVLHALLGLPDGAAAWPWWALGALNAALGAGLLVGMAEAGREKPFV